MFRYVFCVGLSVVVAVAACGFSDLISPMFGTLPQNILARTILLAGGILMALLMSNAEEPRRR